MMNDYIKALEYAFKVLEYNNGSLIGIYQKNYLNIISAMIALEYPKKDLCNIVKEAIKKYPEYPDYRFFLGDFYSQDKRCFDAIEQFKIGIENFDKGVKYHGRAHFSMARAFSMLGDLYYITDQLTKCVETLTQAIRIDPYNFYALEKLLSIFIKDELPHDIVTFMEKIYDYTNLKDILFLLRASLQVNSGVLAEVYYNRLNKEHQECLKAESALIEFAKGNYLKSAIRFKELYIERFKNEYAMYCFIAAHLAEDLDVLSELAMIVKPSLKRVIEKTMGKNIKLLKSDRADVLALTERYIKLDKGEKAKELFLGMEEIRLVFEMAEICYFYENYSMSMELYNRYLEEETTIKSDKLAEVLVKMGDCLFMSGQLKVALEFFTDSGKINPYNYKVYERSILICQRLNDYDQAKQIAQVAAYYFPDSCFINSVLEV